MTEAAPLPDVSFSHVGMYVYDIALMEDFYSRVLGFTVTDRGEADTPHGVVRFVFLSRDPREHHGERRLRSDAYAVLHRRRRHRPAVRADGVDQVLSSIAFSFKVNCPSDFDCAPRRVCEDQRPAPPEINYLAKDYASFRQLMLDRMAVLAPGWTERNAADLGVALVELLAYVGDYLSYQQDAAATESYLGTARRRVSTSCCSGSCSGRPRRSPRSPHPLSGRSGASGLCASCSPGWQPATRECTAWSRTTPGGCVSRWRSGSPSTTHGC